MHKHKIFVACSYVESNTAIEKENYVLMLEGGGTVEYQGRFVVMVRGDE